MERWIQITMGIRNTRDESKRSDRALSAIFAAYPKQFMMGRPRPTPVYLHHCTLMYPPSICLFFCQPIGHPFLRSHLRKRYVSVPYGRKDLSPYQCPNQNSSSGADALLICIPNSQITSCEIDARKRDLPTKPASGEEKTHAKGDPNTLKAHLILISCISNAQRSQKPHHNQEALQQKTS